MNTLGNIAANKERQKHLGVRIIRVNFPISRKQHDCVICGDKIERSTQYVRAEYVSDYIPHCIISDSSHVECNTDNVFIEYAVDCSNTLPDNTPFYFTKTQ